MAKYMCSVDGFVTDQYVSYYSNMAKSGAALITPGIMVVDPGWPYISKNQPWLSDDKYIPGLKKFVTAVHDAGSLVCFQLWHPGLAGAPGRSINTFSVDFIQSLQDKFVDAARRAKEAGADAVDVHGAHTYLISQFLSPFFNHRLDRYGAASVEDAARFSLEIIDRIRADLADRDFFITAKINGSDFVPNGMTPERAASVARLWERAGVAMVTVNGGGVLTRLIGMSDDGRQPEGWKAGFAETVKNAVSIPVAASGSLRSPEYIDRILRDGICDLVSIGRGLLAEPRWLVKAGAGREREMRRCISCMYCFEPTPPGVSGCSVNPFAKREAEISHLHKNGSGRLAVIIGAGPSGLEAAVTLAERGFKCVIFESHDRIGGLIRLAVLPPGKAKLGWMIDYYQRQIDRLGIEVRLSSKASPEAVRDLNPYVVVAACGSIERVPPIQGIAGPDVVSVRSVLERGIFGSGRRILILGGGMTGLETARLFRCRNNEVTVLEMLDLSPASSPTVLKIALEDIHSEGVQLKTRHQVISVAGNTVMALNLDSGKMRGFSADKIILSMGLMPESSIADAIEAEGLNVRRVGDCLRIGKISDAVQSGSMSAYSLT
jgi:2,4-dienoyl-CoA reductase-like NADH-dependent reductase (Old Yellow Enzyme family)/thioredoxin reductase